MSNYCATPKLVQKMNDPLQGFLRVRDHDGLTGVAVDVVRLKRGTEKNNMEKKKGRVALLFPGAPAPPTHNIEGIFEKPRSVFFLSLSLLMLRAL